MFDFGKIVLIPFPFTDLTSSKIRPALIISAKNKQNNDVILAFISSQKSKTGLKVKKDHRNNLKVDSVIRFDKIATLNKKLILGELGEISRDFLIKHKAEFYKTFGF